MTNGSSEPHYFGNDDQQGMMRRAYALWRILRDDPLYSYYGRNVALAEYDGDAVDRVDALARLQGASSCFFVPLPQTQSFRDALEQRGYKTDRFENWRGQESALDASEKWLAERSLADDLTVVTIDADTPDETMAALDRVTASCGVLLPQSNAMRGLESASVCLLAMDGAGQPVASAASVATNHRDNPLAGEAWWGMLATREDRRGEGIAIVLGAMALQAMHRQHGFSAFYTGVRAGNGASESLCSKLGFSCGDYGAIAAIDAQQFAGGRITK